MSVRKIMYFCCRKKVRKEYNKYKFIDVMCNIEKGRNEPVDCRLIYFTYICIIYNGILCNLQLYGLLCCRHCNTSMEWSSRRIPILNTYICTSSCPATVGGVITNRVSASCCCSFSTITMNSSDYIINIHYVCLITHTFQLILINFLF